MSTTITIDGITYECGFALAHRIERLRSLLLRARPFITDAGSDEDPEAQARAIELRDEIDATINFR